MEKVDNLRGKEVQTRYLGAREVTRLHHSTAMRPGLDDGAPLGGGWNLVSWSLDG